MGMLHLNQSKIDQARYSASLIAEQLDRFIAERSTVAIERTVLRLLGIDGVHDDIPYVNLLVEHLREKQLLEGGAFKPLVLAMLQYECSAQEVAERVAQGALDLSQLLDVHNPILTEGFVEASKDIVHDQLRLIAERKQERQTLISRLGEGSQPYLYVIVATGDIYEDVRQARVAARQGADIIAVIRSTGQSLLDYMPYGATREGYGGTYATQENFKIMRAALDDVGEEIGRYIRLCNYCSGLCMPEIAAAGALERLDVMLNDALYGILFRDINMQRTLVDQYFSRMINSYAGIIINTGEDNYLTTADALEAAHTVLASQFINEQFAYRSGLPAAQLGLGHAFEMNPTIENGFLLELAQAQMARQIFPDAPLKYMPPTKHMTGNVFKGHLQDALFNIVSIMTNQGIQLLGMMTEAMHTPFMQDRKLALENAQYIFNNLRSLGDEIEYKSGGIIETRAQEVLEKAAEFLEEIADKGLFEAIEEGLFADVKRPRDGGRGLSGVFKKNVQYMNPFEDALRHRLGLEPRQLIGGKRYVD